MGVNQDTRALVGAFKTGGEQKNRTYQAEVTRIDDEGVVWVNVAGSDIETPTAEIAAEVKRGDSVNVEWRNNKLYIAGNYSNPSAGLARTIVVENTANAAQSDATIAREAATSAVQSAATAGRAASVAQAAAEAAQETANTKRTVFVAQPMPPYHVGDLWVREGDEEITSSLVTDQGFNIVDSDGNLFEAVIKGATVYVCVFARSSGAFDESDWSLAATDNTSVNELREWFWHDATGAHVLGDATGFRNDITSTGMQIIDTSTETSVATFGASGVQIGRNGEMHFEQTSTEMQFIDAQDIIRSKITADSTNGICIEDATYQFYIKSSSSGIELVDDQNNGLKVDSGGVYINNVKVEDFVVDEGTSGSWRYRKWNGGKIEAWFEGTFSCAASTTARGALYYSAWILSIPSAIGFSGTPNTLIGNTGDSETVIAVNGAASSATAMSGNVWRYASSSSALTISARIYAWQD